MTTDINLLLFGFNSDVLTALNRAEFRHVVVVEEPDVWEAKGLAAKAPLHPCLDDVRLATFQQDNGYQALIAEFDGRVKAVAAGLEYAVTAAADAAQQLGCRGASVAAAEILRDKIKLRQALVGSGLMELPFAEVHSAQDVARFATAGPCVLKPANRQASLGVTLINSETDIDEAWSSCIHADEAKQLANRDMSWRYLVEQRVFGQEVSIEALVQGGIVEWANLTLKSILPGPSLVESGHIVGSAIGDWAELMQQFAQVIGYQDGILHGEWMITEEGPCLIECAGRPPGDHITDLIDLAYGGNILWRWIRLLQGEEFASDLVPEQTAVVQFVVPNTAGRVTEIGGCDSARQTKGVVLVDISAKIGDEVGCVESSWDRLGSIIAIGDNASEAQRRVSAAVDSLRIAISPR